MKEISIRIPEWMLELVDKLIKKGIFVTRSEFVRYAIRLALKRYEDLLWDDSQHIYSVKIITDKTSPKKKQKKKKQTKKHRNTISNISQ